jgi:hypothetical protein
MSRNLGALTLLDPSGPAWPVIGVLYLYFYLPVNNLCKTRHFQKKYAQNSSHCGPSQFCMKKKEEIILGRFMVRISKNRASFVGALLIKFCANNKESMTNFQIIRGVKFAANFPRLGPTIYFIQIKYCKSLTLRILETVIYRHKIVVEE